jgi:hypothetical protein
MGRNLSRHGRCSPEGELVPELVDLNAWNRYCAALSVFKLYGKPWCFAGVKVIWVLNQS